MSWEDFFSLIDLAPNKALFLGGVALQRFAWDVMNLSKALVPVRSGALRDSGVVSDVEFIGTTANVELGYGNEEVTYAVLVHEDLGARHTGGGQAKYLEEPMVSGAAPNMEAELAADPDLGNLFEPTGGSAILTSTSATGGTSGGGAPRAARAPRQPRPPRPPRPSRANRRLTRVGIRQLKAQAAWYQQNPRK